jgi:hypothetical protein
MKFYRVKIVTRNVSSLLSKEWEEMWNLSQKYSEMSRDYFEQSIRCSQKVLLTYEIAQKKLVGMAAVEIYPLEHENRKVLIFFTGGVLLDPSFRGKNILQMCAINQFFKTRLRYPTRPCFWVFSALSYKSYLLLNKNFKTYWPNPDQSTPSSTEELMETLGLRHYGELWNAERKVVQLGKYRRFKPWVAPIDSTIVENRWVQFYLEKNPYYTESDSLLCLAPLTFENWFKIFFRMIQRKMNSKAASNLREVKEQAGSKPR